MLIFMRLDDVLCTNLNKSYVCLMSVVWYLLLPLINSFNKIDVASYHMQAYVPKEDFLLMICMYFVL